MNQCKSAYLLFFLFCLPAVVCTLAGPPAFSESDPHVVLFGVDGADWQIVDPLIEAGELPNLARLKSEGVYGDFESIEPMLSPMLWTSIATGKLKCEAWGTWALSRNRQNADRTVVTILHRRERGYLFQVLHLLHFAIHFAGPW